jgi:hypothetical protein
LEVNRISKINGKQEEQYSMVIVAASKREQVRVIKPISNHKAHHFPCSSIVFVRGLTKWYTNPFNRDAEATEANNASKGDKGKTPEESGIVDVGEEKDTENTTEQKTESPEAPTPSENKRKPVKTKPTRNSGHEGVGDSKIVGLCSIVTASWGGDIKYWEFEDSKQNEPGSF